MECVICADEGNEQMHTLECGHQFHASCLLRWFRQSPACPLCRSSDTSHLSTTCVKARASILQQHARMKTAPKELKKLAIKMSTNEQKLKDADNALRKFEKAHVLIFREYRRQIRSREYRRQKFRTARRELGVYSGVRVPLLFK